MTIRGPSSRALDCATSSRTRPTGRSNGAGSNADSAEFAPGRLAPLRARRAIHAGAQSRRQIVRLFDGHATRAGGPHRCLAREREPAVLGIGERGRRRRSRRFRRLTARRPLTGESPLRGPRGPLQVCCPASVGRSTVYVGRSAGARTGRFMAVSGEPVAAACERVCRLSGVYHEHQRRGTAPSKSRHDSKTSRHVRFRYTPLAATLSNAKGANTRDTQASRRARLSGAAISRGLAS